MKKKSFIRSAPGVSMVGPHETERKEEISFFIDNIVKPILSLSLTFPHSLNPFFGQNFDEKWWEESRLNVGLVFPF
jgi:hypothetical protein